MQSTEPFELISILPPFRASTVEVARAFSGEDGGGDVAETDWAGVRAALLGRGATTTTTNAQRLPTTPSRAGEDGEEANNVSPLPAPPPPPNKATTTTVPLSGGPNLTFSRKPVPAIPVPSSNQPSSSSSAPAQSSVAQSLLAKELKFTIYLPNRKPLELRLAKSTTVEQAIKTALKSSADFARANPKNFEMRMHDSDGLPDDDYPAFDRQGKIVETGETEMCLCQVEGTEDDDEEAAAAAEAEEGETAEGKGGDGKPAPAKPSAGTPSLLTSPTAIANARRTLLGSKGLQIVHMENRYTFPPEPGEKVAQFLSRLVRQKKLPLYADGYQLEMTRADKERFAWLDEKLDEDTEVGRLEVDVLLLTRKRYLDVPPEVDARELETSVMQEKAEESRRRMEIGRGGDNADERSHHHQQQQGGFMTTPMRKETARGDVANNNNNNITTPSSSAGQSSATAVSSTNSGHDVGGNVTGATGGNVNNATATPSGGTGSGSAASSTAGLASASSAPSSASRARKGKLGGGPSSGAHVDPESILLNEIKAAVYEEWPVTKINKWNRAQERVMGVDFQKIYNKRREGDHRGGKGGGLPGQFESVKRAERLISDVVSINMDPSDACGFHIVFKDGPATTTQLHYKAEDAESAAQIVAKIRYIKRGREMEQA